MQAFSPLYVLPGLLISLSACGDDGGPVVDAMPAPIDAMPGPSDAAPGVACPNAQASYQGTLFGTSAIDSGQLLEFYATLDSAGGADRLRLQVASASAPPTGALTLPDSAWSVSLCIGGASDSCDNELSAFSGNLQVDSTSDRLKANLSQVLFVDDIGTPTCSAALSGSSIDVAISGPP